MSLPRVIILAAGQGSRLGELTRRCHKSLLPILGEPLLVRTVRQLQDNGFYNVTVVVGHLRQSIEQALNSTPWVKCVENPSYASDSNIGSLLTGLGGDESPALVIEADVALDDLAVAALAQSAAFTDSIWHTYGPFREYQIGGILQTDVSGWVTDLRYVPRFEQSLSRHRKLLGVLQVGPAEMRGFQRALRTAAAESTAQYYMMPWVRHLAELPCRAHDLAHCRAATFNTPEEYRRCQLLFSHPAPLVPAP